MAHGDRGGIHRQRSAISQEPENRHRHVTTDRVSLWRVCEIVSMDDATIQAILDLQKQFMEHWGRWPTVQEIRKQLIGG